MTALIQTLSRLSADTGAGNESLKEIAILCGGGLVVSILFAMYGPTLDLSTGFF
jgi:hypothetical protein